MWYAMVLFVANKGDKKSISFHIWNGEDDLTVMPFVSNDDESERPMVSTSDDDELKSDHDELHRPVMPTRSGDDEFNIPFQRRSILQHGIAAVAYYLLVFFPSCSGLSKETKPLNKLGHHPSSSNRGSAPPLNGEDEDPIAMPSVSDNDDQRNDSICSEGRAEQPRLMPSLQILQFQVCGRALKDHRYCNNLGWEYLTSLQEINVLGLYDRWSYNDSKDNKVEAVLRRTAQVHTNRTTLLIERER